MELILFHTWNKKWFLYQSLLDADYDIELDKVSSHIKLSKNNLEVNSSFGMTAFGQKFRYAITFSLFTHLTLNSIRRCLIEMGRVIMESGEKLDVAMFRVLRDTENTSTGIVDFDCYPEVQLEQGVV